MSTIKTRPRNSHSTISCSLIHFRLAHFVRYKLLTSFFADGFAHRHFRSCSDPARQHARHYRNFVLTCLFLNHFTFFLAKFCTKVGGLGIVARTFFTLIISGEQFVECIFLSWLFYSFKVIFFTTVTLLSWFSSFDRFISL